MKTYFITIFFKQIRCQSKLILLALIFFYSYSISCGQDIEDKYTLKTLVIDAGHGGKDSGAPGKLSKEKDITLAIALKLGTYVEENIPEVKVIYTRSTDVFVPLNERAGIANKNKADLFISIHVDGWKDPKIYGTSTYVMGLHKTDENLELAKKENSVILLEEDYSNKYEGFDPNSAESYIIFSYMQNTFLEQSLNYASFVEKEFEDRALRKSRGVKQAGFLVLWQTTMPSVLIETGFLTNPKEEKYLMSTDGQEYIASAIYRAFKSYKATIEENSMFATKLKKKSVVSDSMEVSFKIQIASSSSSIPTSSDFFKGIDNVEELKFNQIYKYTVGSTSDFEKIVEYKKLITEKFPDAFIIALDKNMQLISVNEALNIIKR